MPEANGLGRARHEVCREPGTGGREPTLLCGHNASRHLDDGRFVCPHHFEAWRRPLLARLANAVKHALGR